MNIELVVKIIIDRVSEMVESVMTGDAMEVFILISFIVAVIGLVVGVCLLFYFISKELLYKKTYDSLSIWSASKVIK